MHLHEFVGITLILIFPFVMVWELGTLPQLTAKLQLGQRLGIGFEDIFFARKNFCIELGFVH